MAEFDPTALKLGGGKTLQVSEEKVDLLFDMEAEGTALKVGHLVSRGTDPLNQVIPRAAGAVAGQIIGFWYPADHARAATYENNAGTAIPEGSLCRVASPQSNIASTFLLDDAEDVAEDDVLIPSTDGRVKAGAAVAGTPYITVLAAAVAAADDDPVLGRWA